MITWVVSSSVLIVFLLLVRLVFRKRISPRLQYALWLLVALRLLVPVSFGQSSASVMNYIPQQSEPVQGIEQTVTGAGFEIQSRAGEREITQENQINNSVVETDSSLSLAEIAKLVYIAGAAVTLACLAGSNIRFYLRLRRSRRAERKYKGLPVYSVPWLETPCMFGMWHHSIYLVRDLADDQRNYQRLWGTILLT
jgi:beta-lactamase regulating signal transducer with metallopeptidase domain